jgi:iron complex transport system permease protein
MSTTRRRSRQGRFLVFAGLTLLLGISIVLAIAVGSVWIPPSTVVRVLATPSGAEAMATPQAAVDVVVIRSVRLPRVLVAVLVGAALAVAGAQMQGLFQNPMASPDVIATSSGAALGAVLAIVLGLAQQSTLWLPIFAFGGALASLATVYALTTRRGRTPIAMLLLSGVALNSLLGALISFVITLHFVRYEVAQEVMFWLLGGLDSRTWTHVWMAAPPVIAGLAASFVFARDLDVLLTGEETAASLGVDVERVKRIVLCLAALLTGTAVAVSGMISFVGLIVPHVIRLFVGPAHRLVIAGSALLGAAFLVNADLVARTVRRPEEMSLGIVTALCGAPFFLYLLGRFRREVGYL